MRIVLRLVSTAVALAVAAWLFDGIGFRGPSSGSAQWHHKLLPLLVVAAILGLITSFVKPILTLLSIPLIIITLGFFLLVLNALMLVLASHVAHLFGVHFFVHGFWPAVGGAIVITIVTWVVDGLIGTNDDDRRGRRAIRS